jgi:ABC-type antimicrobial peptide transport system, ATPase component
VMDLLTGLNAKGQSIVMVTHDMKAACRADRLVIIRDGKVGRILRFGKYDPSELQQREQTIFAAVTGE